MTLNDTAYVIKTSIYLHSDMRKQFTTNVLEVVIGARSYVSRNNYTVDLVGNESYQL